MWETKALGSGIEVKHGFAFPGSGFSDDPTLPTVLTPANFAIGGGFQQAKTKTFAAEFAAEYELAPGDLIVSMTDLSKEGATLGSPALVPTGGRYLHNQRIGLVTVKKGSGWDRRFLHYYMRTAEYRAHILGTATGSTVRHTSPSRITSFAGKVPLLNEQVAIAEVLGALDDKIAANERTVDVTDRLARTTVARSVVGVCALSDIAQITMGSSPPGTSYNEAGEGLPFYQGVRDFGMRTPTRRVFTTSPVRMAARGDTLLSVRAPVGRVNVATEAMCLGRGLAGLRSSLGAPWLLMHQVASAHSSWAPYNSEGTVFGAINKGNVASALVPAIPEDHLSTVEAEVAPLEESIAALTVESEKLVRARDALLPLLMSGKLRVKDAERTIEEVL